MKLLGERVLTEMPVKNLNREVNEEAAKIEKREVKVEENPGKEVQVLKSVE